MATTSNQATTAAFTLIELMIVVAIIAIIAAIAIPNLLESRMQANESNAILALKEYATAQHNWKKAKYGGGDAPYASKFTELGNKDLIPLVFVNATGIAGSGYQGYYFVDDTSVENWHYDFGLYAYPLVYTKSGVNAFHLGAEGTVLMRDQGSQGNEVLTAQGTWTVP